MDIASVKSFFLATALQADQTDEHKDNPQTRLLEEDDHDDSEEVLLDSANETTKRMWYKTIVAVAYENFSFKNWFMLSVRISSYGCTREVWRARKKRKSCSRR